MKNFQIKVREYSKRISSYFHKLGYRKGDVVALLSTNRPEYAAIWMGLAEIGVQAALINSNLRNLPLIHSIKKAVTGCKAVIYEADLEGGIIHTYINIAIYI